MRRRKIIPTPPPPDDYREPWYATGKMLFVDRSDESGVFGLHSSFRDPATIFEESQENIDNEESMG